MSRAIYNPEIHAALVALSYAFETKMFWDQYQSGDHRIGINHRGRVILVEDRDLALEEWLDQQRPEGWED